MRETCVKFLMPILSLIIWPLWDRICNKTLTKLSNYYRKLNFNLDSIDKLENNKSKIESNNKNYKFQNMLIKYRGLDQRFLIKSFHIEKYEEETKITITSFSYISPEKHWIIFSLLEMIHLKNVEGVNQFCLSS